MIASQLVAFRSQPAPLVPASFAVWVEGSDDFLVQVFPDNRHHAWPGCMDLASREFADEIGSRSVGNVDYVEAQLFCGGPGGVGLGIGKPGRVRLVGIAEAKHDDFGGGITTWFGT